MMPQTQVAPYAGAWIEIRGRLHGSIKRLVAPYAGAWIEIIRRVLKESSSLSLPTRERGLKFRKMPTEAP